MQIFVAIILMLISPSLLADTFSSPAELKVFTDKVMTRVSAGDFEGGLKLMKPYTIIPSAEFETMVGQTKLQLPMISQRFGKSIGREFIREEKIGESLIKIVQLHKFENHAMRWNFYFYKNNNGWVLNTFNFDDRIHELFPR